MVDVNFNKYPPDEESTHSQNKSATPWGLAFVVVVLAGIVSFAGSIAGDFVNGKSNFLTANISSQSPDSDKWQAIFLDNNQVYFGKLEITNNYYVLKEIYYLQADSNLSNTGDVNTQQSNTRLVKFGNELHGPEDEMFIEKSKVLFWENMRDDSNVVEAINQSN
ncbi:MAG: hypothetical protein COV29_03665 [Candidatus Yanofskybacteria bacterium CG10_big_fil_rev_8_21_14_0_10_36_16]|uniref:Uncharacterized protein n=1 Tax=Candidatus Yanofskybacteria bacterium CG10_big_fil_rev_8_21_14_0_10_36_16 TaxID=1975096 RepID=A0A2J0Q6N9_9BACT|nr:MAG: hypothetical protein COV29_03665 [Candidatus Yanofskybacteria bacterium CG10_big_fil_rev_8_21_14_0_10_36_16]